MKKMKNYTVTVNVIERAYLMRLTYSAREKALNEGNIQEVFALETLIQKLVGEEEEHAS